MEDAEETPHECLMLVRPEKQKEKFTVYVTGVAFDYLRILYINICDGIFSQQLFHCRCKFYVASAQKGKFLNCLFFGSFEFSEICENQICKNVKLEGVQGVITVPQTPPVAL